MGKKREKASESCNTPQCRSVWTVQLSNGNRYCIHCAIPKLDMSDRSYFKGDSPLSRKKLELFVG